MSVHVRELHTDVTTDPSPPVPAEHAGPADAESEHARRRAEWVRERVAAEGFDD